jgi:hypothetical protein
MRRADRGAVSTTKVSTKERAAVVEWKLKGRIRKIQLMKFPALARPASSSLSMIRAPLMREREARPNGLVVEERTGRHCWRRRRRTRWRKRGRHNVEKKLMLI